MSARRANPALAWLVRSHPRELMQKLYPPVEVPPKDYASRLAILRQRLPDGFTCQRIQDELRWPLNPARDIVRDAKLAGDAVPVGGGRYVWKENHAQAV